VRMNAIRAQRARPRRSRLAHLSAQRSGPLHMLSQPCRSIRLEWTGCARKNRQAP
jgi:hypothetical protein